ncbi:hypothetical protein DFH09DRAFT_1310426 [Mycena vulgaris]|nr:hypothetical protein DFH09DRAFT_1310426 [Mycena vulgaris]
MRRSGPAPAAVVPRARILSRCPAAARRAQGATLYSAQQQRRRIRVSRIKRARRPLPSTITLRLDRGTPRPSVSLATGRARDDERARTLLRWARMRGGAEVERAARAMLRRDERRGMRGCSGCMSRMALRF